MTDNLIVNADLDIAAQRSTFLFLSSTLFPPYLLLSSSSSNSYSSSTFEAEVFFSLRFTTIDATTTMELKKKNNGLYGMRSKMSLTARRTIGNNQNNMLLFIKLVLAVIVLSRSSPPNRCSFVQVAKNNLRECLQRDGAGDNTDE